MICFHKTWSRWKLCNSTFFSKEIANFFFFKKFPISLNKPKVKVIVNVMNKYLCLYLYNITVYYMQMITFTIFIYICLIFIIGQAGFVKKKKILKTAKCTNVNIHFSWWKEKNIKPWNASFKTCINGVSCKWEKNILCFNCNIFFEVNICWNWNQMCI